MFVEGLWLLNRLWEELTSPANCRRPCSVPLTASPRDGHLVFSSGGPQAVFSQCPWDSARQLPPPLRLCALSRCPRALCRPGLGCVPSAKRGALRATCRPAFLLSSGLGSSCGQCTCLSVTGSVWAECSSKVGPEKENGVATHTTKGHTLTRSHDK